MTLLSAAAVAIVSPVTRSDAAAAAAHAAAIDVDAFTS